MWRHINVHITRINFVQNSMQQISPMYTARSLSTALCPPPGSSWGVPYMMKNDLESRAFRLWEKIEAVKTCIKTHF